MNRRDYFFRQLVTEDELDAGFEQAEQADRAFTTDFGMVGVADDLVVTQHSPTPDLTVDVSAGAAYDQQGQRCAIVSTQNPDLSVDSLGVSTAVTAPGNEKYVGLYIKFARELSDPRLDGNGSTVYFVRSESFTLHKVQGAEAVIPTAVRPALLSDGILIADARLIFGQTQILNADITTTRKQWAFVLTAGAVTLQAGTPEAADQALFTQLANSANLAFTSSTNWEDGTGIAATNVQAAINEIVSDLASVVPGVAGALKVGYEGAGAPWTGAPYNLPAADIHATIYSLLIYCNNQYRTRSVTTTPFTIDTTLRDHYIFVDTTGGAITMNLPSPAANTGRLLHVFDKGGVFGTNACVLHRAGAEKINGLAADYSLVASWGHWQIVCDGTDWYVH